MKIYSWNILYSNKHFDEALRFIETLDFDVLCLQEVPEHLLERLMRLPFHVASGVDVTRLMRDNKDQIHLAILSKHPITRSREFPIPVPTIPWRTRLLVRLLQTIDWRFLESHGGMWVDIESPAGIVRVFNVHLTLAYPRSRREEFEMAAREIDPQIPTIIAGDFNILESRRITILNWLLGGNVSDAVFWHRERAHIEHAFAAHGLQNPLRGTITHPFSASQLDHILVPSTATILQHGALEQRVGSDHRPVYIEATL